MFAQIDARTSRLRDARSLVLAVVAGDSMREVFERDPSVVVLDSGSSLNPSTEELLDAIHSAPVEEIVVLTGSANVTPAANKAAEMSGRKVVVVETLSVQESLAVLHHHYSDSGAEENAGSLTAALASITSGGVAQADKDDPTGRYATGDSVGFVDGELVAWGEPLGTLNSVFDKLPADSEIVTLIEAEGSPFGGTLESIAGDRFDEVEYLAASHPGWWVLITA
jgi:dihydroxyacetone kinase-like predicted kinase